MKSAHRSYKRNKGEKSFSDCLKSSWMLAKLQETYSPENTKARNSKIAENRNEAIRNSAKATSSSYDDLSIPSSAYYSANSTGRLGAHYVGD